MGKSLRRWGNPFIVGWSLAMALVLFYPAMTWLEVSQEAAYRVQLEALPEEILHPVAEGQDLHLLAAYYYGDARQWVRIFQANRAEIKNPNQIYPGQTLRIPVGKGWEGKEPFEDWVKKVKPGVSP